jgi:hypothetical protein
MLFSASQQCLRSIGKICSLRTLLRCKAEKPKGQGSNFLHRKNNGDTRNNGTAAYWLTIDAGKTGLWSVGALFW